MKWRAGTYRRVMLAGAMVGGAFVQAEPFFVDEALLRGVDYVADGLEVPEVGVAGQSQGAAFVDLDMDGDDDLVLVGEGDGDIGVFENDGEGYFSRLEVPGIPMLNRASSVSAADFDADGDFDLFLGQFNDVNFLLRNEGEFSFVDVTDSAGVSDQGATTGTTWGDYDGDGFLDLYVGNYPNSYDTTDNRLYRNLGDGTFEEIAETLGVSDPGGMTFQASFVDYDLDGAVDLYSVNDRGGVGDMLGNRLWRNRGDGTFQDVSAATHADLHIFAMGIGFGDMDNNGWPDFYVTNIEDNALLLGNGTAFQERGSSWEVLGERVSWGAVIFDCDNDGASDIMVCNTAQGESESPAPRLFECEGGPPCTDRAESAGFDLFHEAYGVTASDIDDDGDVDLLLVRPDFPISLYVNQAEQEGRFWLKVRLMGTLPNSSAVGATVFVESAGTTQQRAVVCGSSYKSQLSTTLHFGLDLTPWADRVEVLWPGGERSCIPDVAADQTLAVDSTWAVNVPAVPTGPVPADGADVDPAESIELAWTDLGDVSYDVFFGETAGPPFLLTTKEPHAAVAALTPGRTYFWRVEARACEVSVGPEWSFTADIDETPAPDGPAGEEDEPPSEPAPAPVPMISIPTSDDTWESSMDSVILGGTTTGSAVTVSWSRDNGAGGPCTGTAYWSTPPLALDPGDNLLTITSVGESGVSAADQLLVIYTPATPLEPVAPNDNSMGPDTPPDLGVLNENTASADLPTGEVEPDNTDLEAPGQPPASDEVADNGDVESAPSAEVASRPGGLCGGLGWIGVATLLAALVRWREA